MYVPESGSPTEDRDSVSPLLDVTSLSPPIVLTIHFHWGLSFWPLIALLLTLKRLSPSTPSPSNRRFSLVGWSMRVVGEVTYPVAVCPKLLFSLVSVGSVSCPWVTALLVACVSVLTRFSVLLVMLTVVALEALSRLLVFERCLTFTPSIITWPLQVRTSSLPGGKTNTPGAGSAQKNKQTTRVTALWMYGSTNYIQFVSYYTTEDYDDYARHRGLWCHSGADLRPFKASFRYKKTFLNTNMCAAVWSHLTVRCSCNSILCIMPSLALHTGCTPVDTGMKCCITTPSLLPLSVCFLPSSFLFGPKIYTLCLIWFIYLFLTCDRHTEPA